MRLGQSLRGEPQGSAHPPCDPSPQPAEEGAAGYLQQPVLSHGGTGRGIPCRDRNALAATGANVRAHPMGRIAHAGSTEGNDAEHLSRTGNTPRPRRRLHRLTLPALTAALAVLTAGCSVEEVERGWLPGESGITDQTDLVTRLWVGSWIAALVVGAITWALIIWAVVVYRRRKRNATYPPQLRYHVPLEVMYTVIPFMVVGVLFFHTVRAQAVIESRDKNPQMTVEIIAKQWSWDFNYVDAGVYDTGVQVATESVDAVQDITPTLYLPVGTTVEFEIESRDVIHSVWVPEFLYKKDAIPGRTNYYQFTPLKTGTYIGKCAEFCGEFHSAMLFTVKVVEQAEYEAHLDSLRTKGQQGQLPVNLVDAEPVQQDAN